MRIDLHTHTHRSGDSTTTFDDYVEAFLKSELDYVAVTDHLTIDGALALHAMLGDAVIVGQEMRVAEGELIGLFLAERIPPGLTAEKAAGVIRAQGGLVYVPHPGDAVRVSISLACLKELCSRELVDIIEVANSKVAPDGAIPGARAITAAHGVAEGAGSDAHVESAIGSTYVAAPEMKIDGPGALLRALASGEVRSTHSDPPRRWRPRIVPPASHRWG
ncbi:MAG: PHP domain-containing protein [Actinomycetota bacterium]|nr:PHP domain-containing protein [Actinomycetota bacterium]